MKKGLLAAILSVGLLLGPTPTAQSATRSHAGAPRHVRHRHRRGRGSAARRMGVGALGGAAVGGVLGRGRGAMIGGAVGAGAGALHHRQRRRRRTW